MKEKDADLVRLIKTGTAAQARRAADALTTKYDPHQLGLHSKNDKLIMWMSYLLIEEPKRLPAGGFRKFKFYEP